MTPPGERMYKEESDLVKAVKAWLEPQERDGIKLLRICDRYTKGYSDFFINARGRFVVAELKDDTGTPSVQQEDFINDMRRCGAAGGVCRTVKEVSDLVDKALYCDCQAGLGYRYPFIKYCPQCGRELRGGQCKT